jgi:hypothetical protein
MARLGFQTCNGCRTCIANKALGYRAWRKTVYRRRPEGHAMSGPEDNPADDDPHHERRHEIDRLSAENQRLLAMKEAAQELIDYEKIGGPDYLHWQERFDALSAALEKTT